MRRRSFVSLIAVGLSLALLATACSSSDSKNRSATGESAGDPTTLAALPAGTGTGERVPMYFGSVVTPISWVSTSLSPTLSVPGETGAWTFTLTDFSDGKSAFGPKTYAESGTTSRIPLGAGLKQGDVYLWTATSPGKTPVAGSFTVDQQMSGVQQIDTVGGINVSLSSGEASVAWSSHSMGAVPGTVGFGLQFQASNPQQAGLPAGWKLQAASSFPYTNLIVREDGTVALTSADGTIVNYRRGAGGLWEPIKLGASELNNTGLAPVLIENTDGTFAVTTKSATAVFSPNGSTGISYLTSVEGNDSPMLGQSWSNGLIRSVSDPVSNRKIEFVYGGGDCTKAANGFIAAPKDMLCEVKFWDGSTSSIRYVETPIGPAIGRLIDFPEAKGAGAQVLDFAYDQAGRIARSRSPLVASAAASAIVNPTDEQYWTSVSYSQDARVESITASAAAPGATRCIHSYVYEGSRSQANDSCLGGSIETVEFDPTTFFTLNRTDNAGLVETFQWDQASGYLLAKTDSAGLSTVYRYEDGNIVQATGPTKGSLSEAAAIIRKYDQSFVDGTNGVAMKGLDVSYWPGPTATASGVVQELGPRLDGSLVNGLTVNWGSSPAGNEGAWSGLMTGQVQVQTAGEYRVVSGNSTAAVRVNNILCVDGACDRLSLRTGANPLRIDISSGSSAGSIDISWSGPDTGGVLTSIPTDALRPGYGYTTTTETVDPNTKNAASSFISKSSYDAPATGRVDSRTNQAGSKTTFAYEGTKVGNLDWVRPSAVVTADGTTTRTTYWGATESAASPCPGAKSAVQGGAVKSGITPGPDGGDGPTTTRWNNASGALVAVQMPGGVLVCTTYGKAGQVVATQIVGNGQEQKIVNNFAVNGNPLVSETTETNGSSTTTTQTEVDFLGRTVRTTDRYDISTTYTYDAKTGSLASRTITAPGTKPVVIANSYQSNSWLASIAVDGKNVATPGYNADGTTASVVYADGVTARFGYNDQNVVTSINWTTSAGGFANTREVSAAGNQSSSTLTAPSGSSTFTYVHDSNNRLSAASVTAGLVPVARSWEWTFDAASNRLSQKLTENGAISGEYAYSYNKASQLISTTDPAASSGLSYDDRGNATKVGPDSFVYDNANNVVSATDGTTTVRYSRDVSGAVIAKTTEGGSGAGTIQYSPTGVLLDANSRAYAIQVDLPGGVRLTKSLVGAGDQWQFTAINGDGFFMTDGAGTLIGTPEVFDPYGNALTTPNASVPGLPSTTWQAASANESELLQTPYQLMGARVYIPALGRFGQLDPKIGGSANGYDFVNQDPVNASDPSGNEGPTVWDWVSIGASAVVGVIIGAKFGIKIGLIMGAVGGLVITGAVTLTEYLVTGQTQFSLTRVIGSTLLGAVAGGFGGAVRYARSTRLVPRAEVQQPSAAEQLVAASKLPPKVGFGPNRVTMRAISEDLNDSFMSLSEAGRGSRRLLPDMESSFTSNFSQNLGSQADQSMGRSLIGAGAGSYQPTFQRVNFLDEFPVANYD